MAEFGVYVHIPFCRSRCDYCAFATWTDRGHLVDAYVDAVIADIGRAVADGMPVADTVFFGGGTPTLIDPADIARLLPPLRDGRADVVYGSRFIGSGEHRVLYYWHSVGNRLLTTASNIVTNVNLSDMETCYKVFRRDLIQSLRIVEDRFGFEPEITVKIARSGARIYEVGISYSGRSYAEGKKIGWKDGVSALRCLAKYSWLERPSRRARS